MREGQGDTLMPILGYDMVVKCKVCPETARLRIIDGKDPEKTPNMWLVVSQLVDNGFELTDDGEYLCFRHGPGARAPAPVPVLVRDRKA